MTTTHDSHARGSMHSDGSIIDRDLNTYTACAEAEQARLYRCEPDREPYYARRLATAKAVVSALKAHRDAVTAAPESDPRPLHRFPIGTAYMTRGKHARQCLVVDQITLTNSKGEVLRASYVSEHQFCGQRVLEHDVCDTTIARGLLPAKQQGGAAEGVATGRVEAPGSGDAL